MREREGQRGTERERKREREREREMDRHIELDTNRISHEMTKIKELSFRQRVKILYSIILQPISTTNSFKRLPQSPL